MLLVSGYRNEAEALVIRRLDMRQVKTCIWLECLLVLTGILVICKAESEAKGTVQVECQASGSGEWDIENQELEARNTV